jgi:hypothetical protein
MRLSLIEKKVNKVVLKWNGRKHIPTMIRQLNKEFKRTLVCFSSDRFDQPYFKEHNVIVSAHYCGRISDIIPEHIFISLNFPKRVKKITFTRVSIQNLALKIIRAIHHEYRHKHQHRKRPLILQKPYVPKFRQNKFKVMYYGNPDEIDAHAYETQAEKLDINKLRKAHKISWQESEAIYMYRMHFRKQDPKVWKRFLKKVYKNNGCKKEVTNSC